MKKLIFLVLLILGISSISNAQYYPYNPRSININDTTLIGFLDRPKTWTAHQALASANIHTLVSDSITSRVVYADSIYQMGVRIDPFPYWKLVASTSGTMVFRIMVDDSLGNDANDGLTWATAKKTITAAVLSLPTNLNDYKVYILVQGGTYEECIRFHGYGNGQIYFTHLTTAHNSSTLPGSIWYRAGATNPIRTDTAVIIAPINDFAMESWSALGRTLSISFSSPDTTASGNRYNWGKWYFKTSSWRNVQIGTLNELDLLGCIFDNTNGTWEGSMFSNINRFEMGGCFFKGNNNTDKRRIRLEYITDISFHLLNVSWSATQPYTGYNLVYNDTLPSIFTMEGCLNVPLLDLTKVYLVTGGKLALTLDPTFTGNVKYDTATTRIIDNAIGTHTLISNGNITTNYITTKFSVVTDTAYVGSLKTTNMLTSKGVSLLATDSTRTFGAITDSLMVKVTLNGIDYWLKLVK